jgi:hypothetical protein
MKVIKNGTSRPFPYKMVCKDCRCIYVVEDANDHTPRGSHRDETYFFSFCPECSNENDISADKALSERITSATGA